jgi:hypothetical protein
MLEKKVLILYSRFADAVYLFVESGMTLEASPSLQSQIVDRVRIFKELGTSAALVIAVKNAASSQSAIAPKLRSAGILYETIIAGGRIQTAVRGAIALRRSVKKYRPRLSCTRVIPGDPWLTGGRFLSEARSFSMISKGMSSQSQHFGAEAGCVTGR